MTKKFSRVLSSLLVLVIAFGMFVTSEAAPADPLFPGGDGTVDDPYWITNADELNEVRNFLDSNFVLRNDINLGVAPYNAEGGWVPIGTYSPTSPFTGSLDGAGYKISNLSIISNTRFQGLFGYLKDATIMNVNMENVSINYEGEKPEVSGDMIGALAGLAETSAISNSTSSGTIIRKDFVGGLIGTLSRSTLSNSSSSVDILLPKDTAGDPITSYDYDTTRYAIDYTRRGGLVGHAAGNDSTRAVITNSFATGDVEGIYNMGGLLGTGTNMDITQSYASGGMITAEPINYDNNMLKQSESIGGLVGFLNMSTVVKSYSNNIVFTSGEDVGGFVGLSVDSTYTNNYTRSVVSGSEHVAGFIASFEGENNIQYAYSVGTVNVEGLLYGFAPDVTSVTASGVYYDSINNAYSDIKLEPENELGIPYSTLELKSQNTFTNATPAWDFGSIWGIDPEINDGYPYFPTEFPEQLAGGLTVSSNDPSGTVNDGYTKLTVTESVYAGLKFVHKNFGASTVTVPNVGDELTGFTDLPANGLIPAANGDKIGVAEIDIDTGKVARFGQVKAVVTVEPSGTPSTSTPSTPASSDDVEVLVNGKVENIGKLMSSEAGGVKTTIVAVDPAKLQAKLDEEGSHAVVIIPVKSTADVIVGELNGQIVKNMENASATLVLQTDTASYTLPALQININAISAQVGTAVALEDIKVQIEIGAPTAEMVKVVENAATKGSFTIVVPSVEFTVRGIYGDQSIEITQFNAYVERTIAIPDGVDPSRITTGLVVDPDGTERHVPTKIVEIDGKYYAVINSLTNSTYSVVWHPLEFSDVANHWAQDAVNNMGSRMVIMGIGNEMFSPDRDITRAEFVAIVARGLGLKLENDSSSFSDVKATDWHSSAIHTAHAYGMIDGFTDGTFRPDDKITREQAMVIIANAMKITDLKAKLSVQLADVTLQPYTDAADASNWAINSIADSVQAGVVTGRTSTQLAPQAYITRAEVAMMIQNLLQRSGLI